MKDCWAHSLLLYPLSGRYTCAEECLLVSWSKYGNKGNICLSESWAREWSPYRPTPQIHPPLPIRITSSSRVSPFIPWLRWKHNCLWLKKCYLSYEDSGLTVYQSLWRFICIQELWSSFNWLARLVMFLFLMEGKEIQPHQETSPGTACRSVLIKVSGVLIWTWWEPVSEHMFTCSHIKWAQALKGMNFNPCLYHGGIWATEGGFSFESQLLADGERL